MRGGAGRFYCGAPLVAANGLRLGTMSLGSCRPKKLSAYQVPHPTRLAEGTSGPCTFRRDFRCGGQQLMQCGRGTRHCVEGGQQEILRAEQQAGRESTPTAFLLKVLLI